MFKRISVAVAACVLMAAIAASALIAAVPGKRPGGRQGAMIQRVTVERFATVVNLTPEQTQQVKSIVSSLRADVKAAIATNTTREDNKAAVLQLRGAAKDSITALLTPEQREKAESRRIIDKLLSPRASVHQRPMAKLDLSPEQKTQIQAVMKDTTTQMQALKADTALTPEAKRSRAQEIRKSCQDSISALLTPEQRDKFLQWRQNKPAGMQGKSGICPMGCRIGQGG